MGNQNRHEILATFARDFREQIDGIKSGQIAVEGRLGLPNELAKLRRRLDRVSKAANEFGLYVGQEMRHEHA